MLNRSLWATFALASLVCVTGCSRCSGSSGAPDASAPSASSSSAAAPPPENVPSHLPVPDPPEVKDTGKGRATAALRSLLQAYGIPFDAATVEQECKVDEDGASLDDVEEVAEKYGLDASQVILPPEHAFFSSMLPAIVVVEEPDESLSFVLAWRRDGERVEIMDPAEGRRWIARSELENGLYLHDMKVDATAFRKTMGAPAFHSALRSRMADLGVTPEDAGELIVRASADLGLGGFAALDASIRQLALDSEGRQGDPGKKLTALVACASGKPGTSCEGVERVPDELWTVVPKPGPEVDVTGIVMVTVAGKKKPAPPGDEKPAP